MGESRIRGHLLVPRAEERSWEFVEDGLVVVSGQGTLEQVGLAPPDCAIPPTRPGCIWMPGLVDTHIHFPQTEILGSASGELLPWLERSVFPEEQRFAHEPYARRVAQTFCEQLLVHGTTCASIFSSSHPGATHLLFEALRDHGLRADVGLTLMDRGAPEPLLRGVDEAMAACEELVARWHEAEGGRLRFCVTPRFALSCTGEMLRAAGELAARHELPIQTHISENPMEIQATLEAFPEASGYLDVYDRAGLVGSRSLFAHGVWLEPREWDEIARAQCAIAHCPDSNFFLGSGVMPLSEALSRQIRVGLGTDIGAGRSFSVRRCCSRAYDASRLSGSPTDAAELLWLATRGGAVAMGRGDQIGLLAPGLDADLIAVRPPRPLEGSVETLCEQLVFREDWGGVEEVRVRGQTLWSRATTTSPDGGDPVAGHPRRESSP